MGLFRLLPKLVNIETMSTQRCWNVSTLSLHQWCPSQAALEVLCKLLWQGGVGLNDLQRPLSTPCSPCLWVILDDSGPYRWFNTGIIGKTGSSTNKVSGEAKFYLGFKTSSFYHLQEAIAAGKRSESSLLHKASPLWHLFPPEFHLIRVGRKRPVGGCPFSSRNQSWGRCHATAPASLRPPQARKRRGRWREPGSFTLLGHSWGWGLCRRNWGSARAPEGAHPMGSTGTQEQGQAAWDPSASKTHWGRVHWGSSFCQQGQGPAKLCHLCAFCPHCGVAERWSKHPCRVSWSWGISLRPSVPSSEMAAAPLPSQRWGSCSPQAGGKGQKGMKPLQNILLSKQIFPSSGNSSKQKFLPDLYLLQMSSRLDEIFLRVWLLLFFGKLQYKSDSRCSTWKCFLLCKWCHILRYFGHSEREMF